MCREEVFQSENKEVGGRKDEDEEEGTLRMMTEEIHLHQQSDTDH